MYRRQQASAQNVQKRKRNKKRQTAITSYHITLRLHWKWSMITSCQQPTNIMKLDISMKRGIRRTRHRNQTITKSRRRKRQFRRARIWRPRPIRSSAWPKNPHILQESPTARTQTALHTLHRRGQTRLGAHMVRRRLRECSCQQTTDI